MKISDLRARINSYIVLVFLVLMTAFGYALVTHQNMLYRDSLKKIQKSVVIFHQLNHASFQALAQRSAGASVPMSGLGNVLKLDEFLFIRLYDAQGKPVLHLFNDQTFSPESVEAKFPAHRVTRDQVNWTEEDIYLAHPPRAYALGVYSTPMLAQGQLAGYVDYVYDLSAHKNQAFYMASMVIVFLLLTLLMLAVIVNLLFSRFFEDNIQGYFKIGRNGQLLKVNSVMASMAGYSSRKDMLAHAEPFVRHNALRQHIADLACRASGADGLELELNCPHGEKRWCKLSVDAVSSIRGELLYHECLVIDISDKKAKEAAELKYIVATQEINQQLEQKVAERTQALEALQKQTELLARTDPLTQLSNRRDFYDKTQHELNRRKRLGGVVSLMMMDIDYFKHVNDTYGHLSGDQVLKVLSQVSQSVNRETDILARLGGEEFAVFMPDTSQAEAVEVAERLRLALANTAMTLPEGQSIHITVSIGVTSIQATDSHIDDLLKRADAALYAAKNSGRNRVCQTETT
jgi:diguanylate cyclase (GGDEF)-like protein/PAS domain S-box-containing protein